MKDNLAMSKAITIKEVAEYFSVSSRTIRNWMKNDENFPGGFKRYGTLRFRESEIKEYWAKNQKKEIRKK